MASNAEYSNAYLTHLRHLGKSFFFFTAIKRSGSSSFESKGDKKKKVFLTGNGTLQAPIG